MVQWRGISLHIACVALLAVGADGPEPAAALRRAGWRAWALPRALGSKLANNAFLPRLPFARPWPHAPTLLWQRSTAPSQQADSETRHVPPDEAGAHKEYANVLDQ